MKSDYAVLVKHLDKIDANLAKAVEGVIKAADLPAFKAIAEGSTTLDSLQSAMIAMEVTAIALKMRNILEHLRPLSILLRDEE